jgi:hypothetical protein
MSTANMRRVLVVGACLLAPAIVRAQTETVSVDCAAGDTIGAALAASSAPALVVEVHGLCAENVRLQRGNVTLRGTDPAVDGIRGISPAVGASAVRIEGASDVTIERLSLVEAHSGLGVTRDSTRVRVSACLLARNRTWGAEVGGAATFADTTMTGNGYGGLWVGGSARVDRGTITDNVDSAGLSVAGVHVAGGGATLYDTTVLGSSVGLQLDAETHVSAVRCRVGGTSWALRTYETSRVSLNGGSIEGGFYIDGSRLLLAGVSQTAGRYDSRILNDAYARFERWGTASTTLAGSTSVERFSTAVADHAAFGRLACYSGADVSCDSATTATSASCGLCRR